MSDIVQKLWGFCHTLRHDGISYGDYIEQLTYLLFLKMADEKAIDLSKLDVTDEKGKKRDVDCSWHALYKQTGTQLLDYYIGVLHSLGKQPGLLGDIFASAQSRFNNPVNLKRMLTLINETEWTGLNVDVKAQAFEGLLEKAADEGKKGAGQYFTPRLLIKSIVRCMKPDPRVHREFRIGDPACGTGGFLVAAYEWLIDETKGALERDVARRVRISTYFGQDIDRTPRRLALMNLYLHGLEPEISLSDAIYEIPTSRRFDVVLTNPPFGTKGANQAPAREDFTIETSNKQLNFLQHVLTILKPGGRAAIVLPDNCLFEGKAGEVFEIMMQDCNVHTILRLPHGTFSPYSIGVKANVIFFQKGLPTENVWIFDARSNVPSITKKERPLTAEHFAEFEKCYGEDPNGRSTRKDLGEVGRFRKLPISNIKNRNFDLNITWLKDESLEDTRDLAEPGMLVGEAITEFEATINELKDMMVLIEKEVVGTTNGETPTGWTISALSDVLVSLRDGTHTPPKRVREGIPLLSARNIQNGRVDLNEGYSLITERDYLAIQRTNPISKGDVLLTIVGSIGRSCVNRNSKRFTVQRSVAIARPRTDLINAEYLSFLFRSPQFQAALEELASGTAQRGVYLGTLKRIPISIAPLPEQCRINAKLHELFEGLITIEKRLSKMHRLIGKSESATKLQRLEQSILAKAFRGELVPQDPNDEPASVLLGHIRQSKQDGDRKRRTRETD